MFSFVAIGMQLNRRTSVLNTLFISLLVLLLINPQYLTQVGFQLSYAAVLSIVLIQPHLFNLYKGESRFIKYLWGILSVTIAAQIGVLPLSLFYFHQFPGLFFVSNLLILPFLGIILATGILVMLLSLLNLLPELLANAFSWMIKTLNSIVELVAAKEDFIFQDISFSLTLCITSYLLVAGFILLLKKISYRRIMFLLIAIAVLQISFISEEFSAESTEVYVFHKSRNTVIGVKTEKELQLFHDFENAAISFSFIKNYSVEKDIEEIKNLPLKNLFNIHHAVMLRIDSSGIYRIRGLNPEIILLTNSPRVNLERLINILQPKIIIADGSNYPSVVSRWKKTAEKMKLPFHATGEKGAFQFEPLAEGN
ncbi:ComEC/Rec2 family competence protein [Antarcticibacterium sp. 1MA-6-2]|uniref:ComEC/Rec2 family competence protein n=1 Tax=Antarcticibacterium sp. 1MA-6-2 TaxID=2908210 RepID=UPI0021075E5B|nr:ComEC/Rec2 family competence protein [Antarcticibacterium sp. 1MA-6-2]